MTTTTAQNKVREAVTSGLYDPKQTFAQGGLTATLEQTSHCYGGYVGYWRVTVTWPNGETYKARKLGYDAARRALAPWFDL